MARVCARTSHIHTDTGLDGRQHDARKVGLADGRVAGKASLLQHLLHLWNRTEGKAAVSPHTQED